MAAMRSGSKLEQALRSGKFAVTAELNPPDSASGAHVHMSSVGMCALLTRAGYETVMQVSCRDRNRIAIQGDLLGASAMGVRNVLCLTGDGVQAGDQPEAKPVFDLDSMTLLRTACILRDKSMFLSGRKIEIPPKLFLGAAENPFAPPYDFRPYRLQKKWEAGADFIQTQYCFDIPRLQSFMAKVRELGVHEKLFILVGVGPVRSAKSAEWMRANVPGVWIPDEIIDRLRKGGKGEGKRLCVDIIRQIREIKGVSGVHIMAYKQEELVPEIIAEAGLPVSQPANVN
jgi:methylenetetrahydrofolate reductase (NADH)